MFWTIPMLKTTAVRAAPHFLINDNPTKAVTDKTISIILNNLRYRISHGVVKSELS